ncbi:MAG TPA: DUF4097 family beta strand repeat-containing protein [Candidatus Acidoferrales bacterium]|jgi:DUF4097 and DUF4098 domain-containing protein YvlB|nr:DUF4097 family beta strand repeat-containing protein [Candidatus Acidoferrales bacterium]
MAYVAQLAGLWATPIGLAVPLVLTLAAPVSAHHIEKHYTVDGRPVVTVRNSNGRIEVKSWKKPEVVVVGNHSSEKVEVDTEHAGNRIEVNTHVLNENVKPADMQADYTLTVPEETELQVRTDSGSVIVERVYGDLTFDTVAADVQLQEVGNYLVIRTVGGSVTCTRCLGRIDIRSISGNIQLLQPQTDNVRVETTSGNIYFDGDFQRRGIYSLKNYTGLIEVRFSDTDSFDLNASSIQGTVENQAKLKPDPHGGRHPTSRFAKAFGTFNEGHAKVELSSFSGTIKVRRRD